MENLTRRGAIAAAVVGGVGVVAASPAAAQPEPKWNTVTVTKI